jgi:hypothetical protein
MIKWSRSSRDGTRGELRTLTAQAMTQTIQWDIALTETERLHQNEKHAPSARRALAKLKTI